MPADVIMRIDGWHEKGRFSTSCMFNVAHAFASGIAAGVLMSCLCVICCDAGALFAFFSASGVLLFAVCTFECLLFVVLALE